MSKENGSGWAPMIAIAYDPVRQLMTSAVVNQLNVKVINSLNEPDKVHVTARLHCTRQKFGRSAEEALMHTRLPRVFVAGAIAISITLALLASFAPSEAQVYQARRTADGKPDLNGIWQALNTANWDLQDHAAQPDRWSRSARSAQFLPGSASWRAMRFPTCRPRRRRRKKILHNRLTADPEIKCYLPGVPRATYMPFPFQIVQTPKLHPDGLRVRRRYPHDLHGQGAAKPRR